MKRWMFFLLVIYIFLVTGNPAVFTQDNETKKNGFIDVHVHLCADESPVILTEKIKKPAVTPSSKAQKQTKGKSVKTFLLFEMPAKNLIEQMDGCGVEKAILMPVASVRPKVIQNESMMLFRTVKNYPGRLFAAGGGDVLNLMIQETEPQDVDEKIILQFQIEAERLAKTGIKSFGEIDLLHFSINQSKPFQQVSPEHPLLFLLIDIAEKNNLPIDVHMEAVPYIMPMPYGLDRISTNNPASINDNIAGFERMLDHNKNTRIVWQHIGTDNTGKMTTGLIRRLLSLHANLFIAMKVDERQTANDGSLMLNRIVNDKSQIRPEWLKLFQEFPERFVAGSDAFIGSKGKASEMPQSFKETWNAVQQLPPELAEKIGRENAVRIYNLRNTQEHN